MSFAVSRIALLAAVSALAAASSLATAAESDDACALATSADVGAAVKTLVGAGSYVMPTFKKTCTWTASHAPNGVRIVTLSFEGLQMYTAGKRASTNPAVSFTTLSGIGDEAYYMGAGSLISLHVRKGNTALKVSVYAESPLEQIKSMEQALARMAIAKLRN